MTQKNQPQEKTEPSKNKARADLREFIRQVEENGELVRISGAKIDGEIGALYELSQEHLYPPTLLFEKIPGFDPEYRIVCNVRNSRLLAGEISLDAVKAFRSRLSRSSEPIPPRQVDTGPVLENILEGDAVDLFKFPAPKWHHDDGGHYIGTEDLIITKDPDSGWVNFGTYRVMRQDKTTLSVFIEPGKHGDVIRRKYWERGEACPVAVCVGQAPILGSIASTPVLAGQSEYAAAGGRLGRPIDVVKTRVTGLPIPADAELVFEGYMPSPDVETATEGPFGEWPGYYASADRPEPVTHIKAIYHRNSPIIIGQPPVKPNYPGRQVSIPNVAALWNAIEAAGVPEIKGVWKMLGGGGRFINVISLKQLHAGHAKMAGLVAAGCQPAAYMTRMIIVVDEDIDVTNAAEVMWAMATRWDPKTQTDIIDGCYTGHIDPALSPFKRREGDITTSRIIIYAVRPFHWKDKFPRVNMISREYAREIRLKWQDRLNYLKNELMTEKNPSPSQDQPESLKIEAMADLREFIRQVEKNNELVKISGAQIDCEIGALYELSQEHFYPPALLFDKIPGFNPEFRILTNVRNAKLLVGEITLEAAKAYRSKINRKSEPIPPREVDSGPIFENIIEQDQVDILKFPAPKWHKEDGGNYIGTEDLIITRDPDSGWINFGTYRVMVQDSKTLSVFIEPGKHGDMIRRKYWERGEACPVAVCVGQAPVLGTVASTAVMPGLSEYAAAGGRIGRPIDVVKAKVTGLPIPADAELVFEGYMPSPDLETRTEGPFGEWPGYYASADRPEPIVHVKAIYHRNSLIIVGQPPVKPIYPGFQVHISSVAAIWNAIEAAGVPEIRGVWKMLGGGARFIDVIAIKQLHAGHAKMAGLVAAGCQPAAYMTRMIIVVDEDIDITDPAEVMWAMATRWDPKTGTDIIDGCYTGHIDPTLSPAKRREGDITTSRVIIYAVRPFHWKDKFPKVNMVSREYAREIRLKWQDKLDYLKQK